MARSAGAINIKLSAGTAEFFADVEKANAKIIQFGKTAEAAGHGAASQMQATSAALRVLEGGFSNNLRAAERFTGSVLGLGPVLQAAFPLIGGIAFAGLLGRLIDEARKFFAEIRDAPAKSSKAFYDLDASLRTSNDALDTSNAKLENQIAKLEGRHENTLKIALLEARDAADRLAESLQKDLDKLHGVLDQNASNVWQQLFGRISDKGLRQTLFGQTGFGGLPLDVRQITESGRAEIEGTKTQKDRDAAIDRLKAALEKKYADYIAVIDQQIVAATVTPYRYDPSKSQFSNSQSRQAYENSLPFLEELRSSRLSVQEQANSVPKQVDAYRLGAQLIKAQGNADNAAMDRPFHDRMAMIAAQIDGLKEKLAAIGQPESIQVLAKSFEDSQKAIEEVNKALERHHTQLTGAQKESIREAELTVAQTEADQQWKQKLESATTATSQRIQSLDALTAAIGRGYEATRTANVEARLAQELGEHAKDSQWMGQHAGDVAGLRTGFGAEFDAEHNKQIAESVQRLGEEVAMQKALAAAYADGAAAVERAAVAQEILQQSATGLTAQEEQGIWDKFNASRAKASAEAVHSLELQIAATERLIAATGKGAAAVREAEVQNQIAAIRDKTGVVGSPEEEAYRKLALDKEAQRAADAAAAADRVQQIKEEINLLLQAKVTQENRLAIEVRLQELQKQRLQATADELLAIGTLEDGVQAFFIEMQEQAETTGRIIHDAMKATLDDVSAELAKAMTGQKTNWGKVFQQEGTKMLQSEIHAKIQTSLGALGKLLHIGGLDGPNDGSSEKKALWVKIAGTGKGAPFPSIGQLNGSDSDDSGGGGGALKTTGGIMSGGFGMILHMLSFGGGLASGGSVSPGSAYMVGEDGPEMFVPGSRGSIVPNGRGGSTAIYNIDARGADLGAYNRIARGMAMTHDKAVAHSLQVSKEHAKRTPGK